MTATNPQVAAAYRLADTYQKLAADSRDAQWAEYFDGFAEDLRSALDRAGQLRTADLAAEDLRANVLAIHTPEQIWTDAVVDAETGESEQHALYDAASVLVASLSMRTVCTECAPRMAVSWPCPTARAAGVNP